MNYLIFKTVSQRIRLTSELQIKFQEREIICLNSGLPLKVFLTLAIVSILEINQIVRP